MLFLDKKRSLWRNGLPHCCLLSAAKAAPDNAMSQFTMVPSVPLSRRWQTTIARLGRSCHMASNQPTLQQLEALQRLAFRLLKVCTAQRLYCQSD